MGIDPSQARLYAPRQPGYVLPMIRFVSSLLAASTPEIGSVAPDFTVKDTDGAEHTLSKMVESGNVILAFFPKAFTGG